MIPLRCSSATHTACEESEEASAWRSESVASLLGFQAAGASSNSSSNGTQWRVGKWLLLALLERVLQRFVAGRRVRQCWKRIEEKKIWLQHSSSTRAACSPSTRHRIAVMASDTGTRGRLPVRPAEDTVDDEFRDGMKV